jgi:hypothetical protein
MSEAETKNVCLILMSIIMRPNYFDPIQSLYSIVCRLGFFMYLFIHYGTLILFSVYAMHVPLSVRNRHYIILFILQSDRICLFTLVEAILPSIPHHFGFHIQSTS